MALTQIPTNLVHKAWGKKLWNETRKEMYISKFIGKDETNIIQEKYELKGKAGDTLTFGLVMKLDGQGVDGDNKLTGNEEALSIYDDSVTVNQKRNGVRLKGKMDEQKSRYDLRTTAKNSLKIWLQEWLQKAIICHLSGDTSFISDFPAAADSPSTNRILYGGDATSKVSIASGDYFTTQEIDRLVYTAKAADPKIHPVVVNGKEYYVCIIHPRQAYTLRQDTTWSNAQKDAQNRGDDNPLFTGALGIWNNTIVHEHEDILTYSDYGAGVNLPAARALFLGRQAGLLARVDEVSWKEDLTSDEADYGNRPGFSVGVIIGMRKATFNSEDFGVIALDTYAAAPTGSAHS